MSEKYAIVGENNHSSALLDVLQLTNVTTRRARIYEIEVGTEGVMADEVATWVFDRFTTAPTDTTITPRALDFSAPASAYTDCGSNATVASIRSADTELWKLPVHFRAAFRWIGVPGGEFIMEVTATDGLALLASAPTTTPLARATIHFDE